MASKQQRAEIARRSGLARLIKYGTREGSRGDRVQGLAVNAIIGAVFQDSDSYLETLRVVTHLGSIFPLLSGPFQMLTLARILVPDNFTVAPDSLAVVPKGNTNSSTIAANATTAVPQRDEVENAVSVSNDVTDAALSQSSSSHTSLSIVTASTGSTGGDHVNVPDTLDVAPHAGVVTPISGGPPSDSHKELPIAELNSPMVDDVVQEVLSPLPSSSLDNRGVRSSPRLSSIFHDLIDPATVDSPIYQHVDDSTQAEQETFPEFSALSLEISCSDDGLYHTPSIDAESWAPESLGDVGQAVLNATDLADVQIEEDALQDNQVPWNVYPAVHEDGPALRMEPAPDAVSSNGRHTDLEGSSLQGPATNLLECQELESSRVQVGFGGVGEPPDSHDSPMRNVLESPNHPPGKDQPEPRKRKNTSRLANGKRAKTDTEALETSTLEAFISDEEERCKNHGICGPQETFFTTALRDSIEKINDKDTGILGAILVGIASPGAIVVLQEAAQRCRSCQDPGIIATSRKLTIPERFHIIGELDKEVAYLHFLRRYHVLKLFEECGGASTGTQSGFIHNTPESYGDTNGGRPGRRGNPVNHSEKAVVQAMAEKIFPSSPQDKKRLAIAKRLKRLGERLNLLTIRFGEGVLALVPDHGLTREGILSITDPMSVPAISY